jgi:DNA polymerase
MGWCKPHAHIKKTDPQLYLKAKQSELGLGYGMSWPKFLDTCKTAGLDLEAVPVERWPDIEADRRLRFMLRNVAHVKGDFFKGENVQRVGQLLTAKKIVEDWRVANHKTVDFWASLAQQFKERAMAGADTVAYRMPSGRVKRYFNPQFVKEPTIIVDDDGKERQDYRVAIAAQVVRGGPMNYFTGGSLAENLTQACCRDILMNAIVEIADTHPNWRYVWNIYDECVIEIPEDEIELAQAEIPRIMTKGDRIKEWTEGLMLEVEGDICDKYHK